MKDKIVTARIALLGLCCALSVGSMVSQQQTVEPRGLFTWGENVMVIGAVQGCDGPYAPMHTMVSSDGGLTWQPTGPRTVGLSRDFVLDTGKELLIAGENIIEGPAHDPFLLVYRYGAEQWDEFEILGGSTELSALALETKTGRLLAWIRHLELSDDGWTGPLFLHESMDGGKSWREVKKVARVPASRTGLRFFERFADEQGPWRIVSNESASRMEKRDDERWKPVELPMMDCEAEISTNERENTRIERLPH